MKRAASRRRAGTALGLVIIVFVMVAFCGIVLAQSLEMYRVQVLSERRQQARAGLEAAIFALRRDPAAPAGRIEGTAFSADFADAVVDGDTVSRRVSVDVVGRNGESAFRDARTVVFRRVGDEWTYAGIEP